ncbi:MAG: ribonuclease R [Lachnospiraceae bacterium]|nr:ribonuclease R [Lachnospiraceae bacterium]
MMQYGAPEYLRGVSYDKDMKRGKDRKHSSGGKKKIKSLRFKGIFQAGPRGFGFVMTEEGQEYYIPHDSVHSAMHGDRVEIHVTRPARGSKSAEAEIGRIIDRATDTIVGTFEAGSISRRTNDFAYGFVIPDNRHYTDDVFVSRERSKGAKDGDKVVVRITEYGDRSRKRKSEGIVTEILGDMDAPGVDITSIVRSYGLPERFNKEILTEADEVSRGKDTAPKREDFRESVIITIDGDDSKDFDDAVSLVRKGDFWELGVHIADVSEYVKEGSALDAEALRRGTSVYLPDRVIPMLPEVLSNDVCSLNPGEDRLTLSCVMKLDEKGRVKDSRITEGIIRSRHRMTYGNVQKILDGDSKLNEAYQDIVPMLHDMDALARLIRKRRAHHGAVDFDLPEAAIILDDDGRTKDVSLRERNDATRLIEDFMILANECVSATYAGLEIPFLYRVHDEPDEGAIEDLALFVTRFGLHLKIKKDGKTDPKELRKLLCEAEDTEASRLISTLALRAMSQAKYSDSCSGHFGLALQYYSHFTSPIRRYPDLQIHRIIKEHIRGELTSKRISHYRGMLKEVADISSRLERRADDVERDADKLKMVEYMQSRIGEEFEGVISSVTDWGIYVELPNCIEGMILLRNMTDDYYELDEAVHEVKGRATGRRFGLGEAVRVTVVRADKLAMEIDFEIADTD